MRVNVQDHGAIGDGITDDTVAVMNAVTAAKLMRGVVVFPAGVYPVGQTIDITGTAIGIEGEGSTGSDLSSESPSQRAHSLIRWTGGTQPVIRIGDGVTPMTGVHFRDFAVDGGGVASTCIDLDWSLHCQFTGLRLMRGASHCLRMVTTAPGPHDNVQHHLFAGCAFERAPVPILMDGNDPDDPNSNVCHCTFVRTQVWYSGAYGIDIRNADNVSFVSTFIFRGAGTGQGVCLGGRARGNYFFHLEPSSGGIRVNQATVGTTPPKSNAMFGYDRENNQPAPTLDPGAVLDWTETGSHGTGWHLSSPLHPHGGFGSPLPALTPANTGTVNTSYGSQESAVLNNTRTRVGQIEARLRTLGLIQ